MITDFVNRTFVYKDHESKSERKLGVAVEEMMDLSKSALWFWSVFCNTFTYSVQKSCFFRTQANSESF